MTAANSPRNMDLALGARRRRRLTRRAARSRTGAAGCAHRHLHHDREGRRAELRGRRDQVRSFGAPPCCPAPSTRARAMKPRSKQIVCDRLGLDPHQVVYLQGDTDQVFFGEGTGGSRSATIGGSAFLKATEKILVKATALAAHLMKVRSTIPSSPTAIFSSPRPTDRHHRGGGEAARFRPSCPGHGAGPGRHRVFNQETEGIFPTAAMSASWRSIRHRPRRDPAYSVVGRRRHGDQSVAWCTARSSAASPRGWARS